LTVGRKKRRTYQNINITKIKRAHILLKFRLGLRYVSSGVWWDLNNVRSWL